MKDIKAHFRRFRLKSSFRECQWDIFPVSHSACLSPSLKITFHRFFLLHSSVQSVTEQSPTSFTQEDLNQGKIIYHQQAAGGTDDSVLLEATNGVTKVGPVRLEIDIIPILLPLQVQNVSTAHETSEPVNQYLPPAASLCRCPT